MKVRCIANRGAALSGRAKRAGFTDQSVFHVTMGEEYPVYGMALWDSGLAVLICDDTGLPWWYPIELFDVIDRRLPDSWEFDVTWTEDAYALALWGYPALIRDPDYHDALVEREDEALRVFYAERDRRSAQTDDDL